MGLKTFFQASTFLQKKGTALLTTSCSMHLPFHKLKKSVCVSNMTTKRLNDAGNVLSSVLFASWSKVMA